MKLIIIKSQQNDKYYLIEYNETSFLHTEIDEDFALLCKIPLKEVYSIAHFHSEIMPS